MGWVAGVTICGKSKDDKSIFEHGYAQKYGPSWLLILIQPEQDMSSITSVELNYWNDLGFINVTFHFYLYSRSEQKIVRSKIFTQEEIIIKKHLAITDCMNDDDNFLKIASVSISVPNSVSNDNMMICICADNLSECENEEQLVNGIFQKYASINTIIDHSGMSDKFQIEQIFV